MSDERGSIKISTANDIGTSLVTVLGGDGYSPEEWADNINLCGIHAADIENALENIEDSTGSGSERGSFLISIANKIGAVLNKKYNTSRGFKPKEWASAISFLEPLPERTASGAIANIRDGADTVPVKSWGISIPANLAGVNTLECHKGNKNFLKLVVDYPNFESEKNSVTCTLLSDGKLKFNGTATANTDFTFYPASTPNAPHLFVRNGTYTFSCIGSNSIKMVVSGGSNNGFPYKEITNGSYTGTVTDETKPFNYIAFRIANGTALENVVVEPMLESGSSATTYEPYTAPEVSEVDLGRTIYGGTADIVNGQGTESYGYIVFDGSEDETWYDYASYEGYSINISTMKVGNRQDGVCNQLTKSTSSSQGQTNVFWLGVNTSRFYVIGVYESMGNTLETFKAYLSENPLILVYPLATETDFTFDPIDPIPETEETSNLWSDVGDSTVVYRADIDSPEPNSLLGLNNSLGNSNDNNEEEVI